MMKYKETLLKERANRNVLDRPLSQENEVAIKNFLFRKFVLTSTYKEVKIEFSPIVSTFQERKYLDKETLVLPKKEYNATIQWLTENGFTPNIQPSQIEKMKEYTEFGVVVKLSE